MKIAIIGTRGIPDFYRGFEKSAQYLACGLVKGGHDVTVYSSHNHSYQRDEWKGVKLKRVYDPEYRFGALGNLIYDYNCIRDIKSKTWDMVIQFGPSSAIWAWFLPRNIDLISNLSSVEWKRNRHGFFAKQFLQLAERLAVIYSSGLISQSSVVCDHIYGRYKKNVTLIPQGVECSVIENKDILSTYGLTAYDYNLYIGSLEIDSNAEMILDGVAHSGVTKPFIVIGSYNSAFGIYLKEKFKAYSHIKFIGSLYHPEKLYNLRHYSNLYFYGYQKDGSIHLLLEAMAASCLVSAYDDQSNRDVLGEDAYYFTTSAEVSFQMQNLESKIAKYCTFLASNRDKVTKTYDWEVVLRKYTGYLNSFKKEHVEIKNTLSEAI